MPGAISKVIPVSMFDALETPFLDYSQLSLYGRYAGEPSASLGVSCDILSKDNLREASDAFPYPNSSIHGKQGRVYK